MQPSSHQLNVSRYAESKFKRGVRGLNSPRARLTDLLFVLTQALFPGIELVREELRRLPVPDPPAENIVDLLIGLRPCLLQDVAELGPVVSRVCGMDRAVCSQSEVCGPTQTACSLSHRNCIDTRHFVHRPL